MEYQSYEDYMRSVLGYNQMQNNNIYEDMYNNNNIMYENPGAYRERDTEELNEFYPDIYRMIYPMVCKICNQNMYRDITKDLIDKMTDEIYSNFEEDTQPTTVQQPQRQQLRNGDVRNPNVKEPETVKETRQSDFLLRDLIRILLLRELINGRRRPPFGRPPMFPPRPPYGPPNRPRNYWN